MRREACLHGVPRTTVWLVPDRPICLHPSLSPSQSPWDIDLHLPQDHHAYLHWSRCMCVFSGTTCPRLGELLNSRALSSFIFLLAPLLQHIWCSLQCWYPCACGKRRRLWSFPPMPIARAMPLRWVIAWISESVSQQNCVLQFVSYNIHHTWHYKVTRKTKLIPHVLLWTQELIILQCWEFSGDRMQIKSPSLHWVSYILISFSQQYLAFIEMLKFVKFTSSSEFGALCSSVRKFSY